ncbi:hypothetical protein FACS189452_03600 [Bacteroidia bacterium]|nr:hypothetical protein FACS189452_03600 [Bacteroidia bacterium]GHT82689.1 hypothetical protein FACS189467_8090 [Bacteroidia bacterium]
MKKILLVVAVMACGVAVVMSSSCKKKDDPAKTYTCECSNTTKPRAEGLSELDKNKYKEDCTGLSASLAKGNATATCDD